MNDSKFWRKLGKRFKKLDPGACLRLEWRYFQTVRRYHCEVVDETGSRLIQAEFKSLARLAGSRIDPSNPITAWLLQVKHCCENDVPGNGTVEQCGTGEIESYISGMVNRVCEASASLCYSFAAQVFGSEGRIMRPEPTAKPDAADSDSPNKTSLAHVSPEPSDTHDTVAIQALPAATSTPMARRIKRGPKIDHETAARVARIVAEQSLVGTWRKNLENICDELDARKVPFPKTWKKRGHGTWLECFTRERSLVVFFDKAIEHHLERAKERQETFS